MYKKTVLGLVIAAFTVFSGCTPEQNEFIVHVIADGSAVEVVGYRGGGSELRIPPRIQNLPVTAIGESAFRESWITVVYIPYGIRYIREGAFAANQLTGVVIPNSVTYIGVGAFAGNRLASVTIPDSVTYMGYAAFADNLLTYVTIPTGITTIKDRVFFRNRLAGITVPDGVTHIGTWAFADNQLVFVDIPDSVVFVCIEAFDGDVTVSRTANEYLQIQ